MRPIYLAVEQCEVSQAKRYERMTTAMPDRTYMGVLAQM